MSLYDPDDYEPEHECSECKHANKVFINAGFYIKSIIEQLYTTSKNLDEAKLESDLDELCYMFDVSNNPGELQVQRKKDKIVSLDQLMDFTNKQYMTV